MNGFSKRLIPWIYDCIEVFKGFVVVRNEIALEQGVEFYEGYNAYFVYKVLRIHKRFEHEPVVSIPKESNKGLTLRPHLADLFNSPKELFHGICE